MYILNESPFRVQFLIATGGKGARVILNCLSGQYVKDSLDCCGIMSYLIHYGKYDFENGNTIGMANFMKNLSVYAVELKNIVNLNEETKQQLWKLISNGITNNIVTPLTWQCVLEENIPTALR